MKAANASILVTGFLKCIQYSNNKYVLQKWIYLVFSPLEICLGDKITSRAKI